MQPQAILLVSSSALSVGTTTGSSLFFPGGRSALVVNGAVYGVTGVQLQIQGPSPTQKFIQIGSGIITADTVLNLDCPAGQYRISMVGSSSGISAVLAVIPY